MAKRVPHRGYFIKVEVSCDRMGVCCIEPVTKSRRGERICGMDYKIPWEYFNINKRDKRELDAGWSVRKLVPKGSWGEMVDAWGDTAEGGGGLFGARKRRGR